MPVTERFEHAAGGQLGDILGIGMLPAPGPEGTGGGGGEEGGGEGGGDDGPSAAVIGGVAGAAVVAILIVSVAAILFTRSQARKSQADAFDPLAGAAPGGAAPYGAPAGPNHPAGSWHSGYASSFGHSYLSLIHI